MANKAQNPQNSVDLSELEALERQILETDGIIENQQRELWQSGEKLNTLLDSYQKTRASLQKAIWANMGLRICPNCANLKEAGSFRYLYLERLGDKIDTEKAIKFLCAECYNRILEPVRYGFFIKRLPAELREGKVFIFWEGKYRAFEEIFDETSRAEVSIVEDVGWFRYSLFTIGKVWNTELSGFSQRIKKN